MVVSSLTGQPNSNDATPQVLASQIANATDIVEAYQQGGLALSQVVQPARCLIFERDRLGHLKIAYRLDLPGSTAPATDEITLTGQLQHWLLTADVTQPALLPAQPDTLLVPLRTAADLYGIVVLQGCTRPLDQAALAALELLATTLSLSLTLFSLRSQLAQTTSTLQIDEAIMHDRRRIAREIHDGVAQSLAYLGLKVELFERLLERNPGAAKEQAALIRDIVKATTADLRRCIGDLRQPLTGSGNVVAQVMAASQDTPTTEQTASPQRLPPERPSTLEQTVMAIVRESFQNIRKHADARNVRVEVAKEGATLRVTIIDDGQGFRVEELLNIGDHFGLAQMRELAQELGGNVSIISAPGAGTRVEAMIPAQALE